MSFPFLHHSTFDDGTRQNFDSETDASDILTFPDYRELARQGFSPWQGAHALRLVLAGAATAALAETGDFDLAADGTIRVWFPLLIGADLTLAAGDTVILFALDSAGPVNEVVVGVRNNGGVYELFAGETGATRTLPIVRSNTRWYQIELDANIDSGAPNDGTVNFYVDGGQVGAQITGLDQAAITQARLGAISGTAAGNLGTILIGGIIADDLRIYPRRRFPADVHVVTRDLTLVGSGCLTSIELTGTSTDAVLEVFDTDVYEATGIAFSREAKIKMRNVTNNDVVAGPAADVEFSHGAYFQLTGTNPEARVVVKRGFCHSHGHYVHHGLRAAALT